MRDARVAVADLYLSFLNTDDIQKTEVDILGKEDFRDLVIYWLKAL